MKAVVKPHIEAHQHNFRRLHLHGEVKAVETGIAGPSDSAGLEQFEPVVLLVDPYGLDAPRLGRGGLVDGQFQPGEIRYALISAPPCEIAGIESISPRREAPGVVDRDQSAAAFRFV